MTLGQKLNDDYIAAYKAHDEKKVSILRLLRSAIKNAEIATKTDLSDPEVEKILRREIKQHEESIESYIKANRDDLIAKDQAEIELILTYLPALLSEEETAAIVSEVIAELKPSGMSEMGRVIGAVMKKAEGKADGGIVATTVKRLLDK